MTFFLCLDTVLQHKQTRARAEWVMIALTPLEGSARGKGRSTAFSPLQERGCLSQIPGFKTPSLPFQESLHGGQGVSKTLWIDLIFTLLRIALNQTARFIFRLLFMYVCSRSPAVILCFVASLTTHTKTWQFLPAFQQ